MDEELKKQLLRKVGSLDGNILLEKFALLKIEDFTLTENGIVVEINKNLTKEKIEQTLANSSMTGRIFLCESIGKNKIIIRTDKFNFNQSRYWRNSSWGVLKENQKLPPISSGSKILDVGAGDGTSSVKMRDNFKCVVYALEPSFEDESDFKNCVKNLGCKYVSKMTLQEALIKDPSFYRGQFDYVTVFKYNVPFKQREDFIKSLSQVIKPNGVVYLTSVEKERCYLKRGDEALFLITSLKKYFGCVVVSDRGDDGLITCSLPKLQNQHDDSQKPSISCDSKNISESKLLAVKNNSNMSIFAKKLKKHSAKNNKSNTQNENCAQTDSQTGEVSTTNPTNR
jgi:ubiquinone/menaquinone biosynthesis C-methylase UbiE